MPKKLLLKYNKEWNEEIKSAFHAGQFSLFWFMPTLETTDKEIAKLYNMGILGLIYFKRDSPYSVIGRTYDTLMPRYWQSVTFIWDYALSSFAHAFARSKSDAEIFRALDADGYSQTFRN